MSEPKVVILGGYVVHITYWIKTTTTCKGLIRPSCGGGGVDHTDDVCRIGEQTAANSSIPQVPCSSLPDISASGRLVDMLDADAIMHEQSKRQNLPCIMR